MDITIGHSPDADDAFMFYALAKDKIDTGAYRVRHEMNDIESLNRKARAGGLEVTAISVASYPDVADRYQIMPSGGSFGDGYGPVLVAYEKFSAADLAEKRVAVPGTGTSAYLALRLCVPEFEPVVVPFNEVTAAIDRGDADAALIIHEGMLTFKNSGLISLLDLGIWWTSATGGLPLPLGVNAVRRDLGSAVIADLNRLLKTSIQYALDHRADALDYALQFGRGLSRDNADTFVGMYVNDLTIDMGVRGLTGIREFLDRGVRAGYINAAEVDVPS